jgi:hypothetical protein
MVYCRVTFAFFAGDMFPTESTITISMVFLPGLSFALMGRAFVPKAVLKGP